MDYRVKARLREGRGKALLEAIETGALGKGEVFEGAMQRAIREARVREGLITFYETCYCPSPLQEEREYYDRYLEILGTEVVESRSPLVGEPLRDCLFRIEAGSPNIFAWKPSRKGTSEDPVEPPDLCDECSL